MKTDPTYRRNMFTFNLFNVDSLINNLSHWFMNASYILCIDRFGWNWLKGKSLGRIKQRNGGGWNRLTKKRSEVNKERALEEKMKQNNVNWNEKCSSATKNSDFFCFVMKWFLLFSFLFVFIQKRYFLISRTKI